MTEPTGQPRAPFRSAPSGNLHDIERPDPSLIELTDIAHHLALICRYNGGTSRHYSVAEHSIRVALLCPPEMRYRALMHDSPEFALGDVTRGLKKVLSPTYLPLEQLWEAAIAERFGIDLRQWQSEMCTGGIINANDLALGATEGCCLVAGYRPDSTPPIENYDWQCLRERFGARYKSGTMCQPSVAAELFLIAAEAFANAKA